MGTVSEGRLKDYKIERLKDYKIKRFKDFFLMAD